MNTPNRATPNPMKKYPSLIAVSLLIPLSGCSDPLLRNATPAFADGHKDGCASGSDGATDRAGLLVRDSKRYNADAEYTRGWQLGNRECSGRNLNANPGNPLEPVNEEGPDTPTMDIPELPGPDSPGY